jgi:hypothetical protein
MLNRIKKLFKKKNNQKVDLTNQQYKYAISFSEFDMRKLDNFKKKD